MTGFGRGKDRTMNFQKLVDAFDSQTCVISVARIGEDRCGEIRLVAANQSYQEWLESQCISEENRKSGKSFVPDSLYTEYYPKDLGFEDFCYRTAVLKKTLHSYVHTVYFNCWLVVNAMPVSYTEGNLSYCLYTRIPTELSEIDPITLLSAETSADVLKTCIKLHDTKDFRQTMKEVIHDIRLICDAEVCTIMLMDFSAGTCDILATDIKESSTLKRATQFSNFYDIAASWIQTIGERDCLIIKNEQDMEYISRVNNPWYLTLAEAHVNSVVMFPLRYNDDVLGYIWATNFDTRTTQRIRDTLELTTFFLSSEIASYKLMTRLEHISYTDLLTGVRNRNAMNNRISDIVSGAEMLSVPFGVVFADLNGLKRINDSAGHFAGDILLKKAALLLEELFAGHAVYRAGGDEFMVIVSGCSADEFDRMLMTLHKRASDPDGVCFAVGSYYSAQYCDIREALRKADENMYKNKVQYYTFYPERQYR